MRTPDITSLSLSSIYCSLFVAFKFLTGTELPSFISFFVNDVQYPMDDEGKEFYIARPGNASQIQLYLSRIGGGTPGKVFDVKIRAYGMTKDSSGKEIPDQKNFVDSSVWELTAPANFSCSAPPPTLTGKKKVR